jgi:hypothetical protein
MIIIAIAGLRYPPAPDGKVEKSWPQAEIPEERAAIRGFSHRGVY